MGKIDLPTRSDDGLILVIGFMNEYGGTIDGVVEALLCRLRQPPKRWLPTEKAKEVRDAHAELLLQLGDLKQEEQAHLLDIIEGLRLDDAFLGWLHLVLFGWGPSREGRQDRLTLACVRKVHGDMNTPRAYVFPLLVVGADYDNIGIHKGGPQGEVLKTLRDAVTSRYERGG